MQEAYAQQLQALLPQGDLWPRSTRARLTALLSGLAAELARVSGRADDLRREADIRVASELLPDFERVLGPDPCGRDLNALTLADRQRIAHQRWTARGGQSRAYFRELASKLGQAIEIEEYWPSDAGVLQAGADLIGDGEQFVWSVYLGFLLEYVFNAGEGVAGDPLGRLVLSDIECEIRRLAPAHTAPVFSYTLEPEPLAGAKAAFLVNFLTDRMQVRNTGRPMVFAKASETPLVPSWWAPAGGVFVVEARADNVPGDGVADRTVLSLDNGATNQAEQVDVRLITSAVAMDVSARARSGNANSFNSQVRVDHTRPFRLAFRLASGAWALALNGAIVAASAARTSMPANISRMRLGQRGGAPVNFVGQHRALVYYPQLLSDDELIQLSIAGA